MADTEAQRRWRLVLGGDGRDGTDHRLTGDDIDLDRCLDALYGDERSEADRAGRAGRAGRDRRGGLGSSAPRAARWLGDIRKFFPKSVVRVMQRDAFERLGLQRMLLEPEILEEVEPNVHLVSTLISLKGVIPSRTKETARIVVRRVVDEMMRKLEEPTREAISGAICRALRNPRPRLREIDWDRTIRRNLSTYQPEHRTVIPERLVGFGRKRSGLKDIVLCLDQSGSMASSVVYSGVFAAVMASIPAVRTRLVAFDTEIVDLSDKLREDPVDVLFGVQLGGGTDIDRALGYCQRLIERPDDTILVLISDLYEGGDRARMLRRAKSLVGAGVQVIALLALSDEGAPSFDESVAAEFSTFGIPSFACTPELFPDLMAAAIRKADVGEWASRQDIALQGVGAEASS